MPSTKTALDLLKDTLKEKTQGEIVFPVKSIEDCYDRDTLLSVSEQERKITDEAFATAKSIADDATKSDLEFLQSALTPSEILKMSGISVNYEIEQYPLEVSRDTVYQNRDEVEHDGKVEWHLNNSHEQIIATVREAFDKEYSWCKEGVYDIDPSTYHEELRQKELTDNFEAYQKDDEGHATFSDYLYDKYRYDFYSESIAITEKEIVENIRDAVEGNGGLDAVHGEGFKDAVLRYLDESERYEILEEASIYVEAQPVNFMRGDFQFAVTLSTPQEKDMGNSSLDCMFDADPHNIGWLGDDKTVERVTNNALSYLVRSQGYEMSEVLDKFHLATDSPSAYIGEQQNFTTEIANAYSEASTYEVLDNVRMLVSLSGKEALDFIDRITSDPSTFGTEAVLKINAGTNLLVTDDRNFIPTEKDIVVPMSFATEISLDDDYSSKEYSETVGLLQGDEVTSSVKASAEEFMKPLEAEKVEAIKAEMNEWIEEHDKEVDTPSLTDDD